MAVSVYTFTQGSFTPHKDLSLEEQDWLRDTRFQCLRWPYGTELELEVNICLELLSFSRTHWQSLFSLKIQCEKFLTFKISYFHIQ